MEEGASPATRPTGRFSGSFQPFKGVGGACALFQSLRLGARNSFLNEFLTRSINSFGGQKFSALKNAFCRVVNSDTRIELARYDLGNAGNVTGMILAKVERKNGEWEMTAIGEPAGGITVHFLIKAVRKVI